MYTILQDTPEESTTDPQAQIDGGGTPNTYVDLLPETVRIYFWFHLCILFKSGLNYKIDTYIICYTASFISYDVQMLQQNINVVVHFENLKIKMKIGKHYSKTICLKYSCNIKNERCKWFLRYNNKMKLFNFIFFVAWCSW